MLSIIYYNIYLNLFSLLYEIYHLLSCIIILLVFCLSFVAFIHFLFPSSFLFHLSSFIYFFVIFFLLYFKWAHHVLHLHVIIFLVLSPLTHNPTSLWLILREERQDHSNCRENSCPFYLCCCVIGGGGGWGSWSSQFTVFLPTFPSVLFHGPSNPETNHLPRVLSKLISQGDPGNELPQASRGSAIHIFLVYVWMHVSPAEEGHGIGFAITTIVVRHGWHHLYFNVVVDNLYNRLSCQPFFQSYQWQYLTRQFLHLSKKGDKAVRNLVKVLTEKRGAIPPFSSRILQF